MRKRTKFLWKIGIPLIKLWIKFRYDIKVVGEFPAPPYLLLSNHSQNIDPFFILAKTGQPISFVVNNAAFQNPLIGTVLKWLDSIPKQKSTKDIKTVMQIFRWLKSERIVGIFPAGNATWDGVSCEAFGGTSKLLNKVSVPIVAITISGGYLVNPRWAEKRRKGVIEMKIQTFEDEKAMEAIKVSDWEWQEKTGNLYSGKNKALGVEKIMWFCPKCGSYRGITGKGEQVNCKDCSYEKTVMNAGKIGEKTITEILEVQNSLLKDYILKNRDKLVFEGCRIKIWSSKRTLRLKNETGTLSIYPDKFKINSNTFHFDKISGLNTYVSNIIEFIYDDEKLVRIKTKYDSLLITEILHFLGVK